VEGRTRRRLTKFVALGALVATIAAAGRVEQTGTFALLGGQSKIVSKFWTDHAQGLTATLKVRQFQTDGKTPILDYDVDMQHLMHLVVVRDDFATFDHLHPVFDTTTGTFQQSFTKATRHKYYVFADTTPHGIGQQVFRFTLESAGEAAMYKLSAEASSPDAHAGPYTAILQKTTIAANSPQSIDLTIVKGDDPADDLGTYLGAPAHVVLIDMSTLEYVHVHPMVRNEKTANSNIQSTSNGMQVNMYMGAANSGSPPPAPAAGPFLSLMLPALPAGSYKTWVQFRGGYKVYTAAFTIVAR